MSGGLDSATVLAIARKDGYQCRCLSVDYGQRHRAELDAAASVAKVLGARVACAIHAACAKPALLRRALPIRRVTGRLNTGPSV